MHSNTRNATVPSQAFLAKKNGKKNGKSIEERKILLAKNKEKYYKLKARNLLNGNWLKTFTPSLVK